MKGSERNMNYICNNLTVHQNIHLMLNNAYDTKLTFYAKPTFYSFLVIRGIRNFILWRDTFGYCPSACKGLELQRLDHHDGGYLK
jgi:hypothetical protein